MRIVVMGPAGKMGRLVVKEALNRRRDFMIVGGVVPEGREYVRQDIGKATGDGFVGATLYDDLEFCIPIAEAVIDFTTPEATMKTVKKCIEYKRPIVIGTTGFNEKQMKDIEFAAKKIPILLAANTSKTTNLMYEMVELAARALGTEADVEIIDMHDRFKADSPSGTAKEMGQIVAKVREEQFNEIAKYGRDGKREENEIGFHSVRAGDISSTHTVVFGLMGERLEITHRSYNWTSYAKGALDGALFLKGRKPGLYSYRDVINASLGIEPEQDEEEKEFDGGIELW